MMRRTLIALAICAAAVATAAAAPSNEPTAVLGDRGELVNVEHLTWGDLNGNPGATGAEDSVLALRVRHADNVDDQLIGIPATFGPDTERTAALLYEESSQTFYVAWESVQNYIHSRIRLVGYRDGEWTEPIDVSDSRFALKSDPQLAVTRDSYEEITEEGESIVHKRTALHVVWTEERAEGLTVAYSPLVLLDGESSAPGPIFALTDLVSPPEEELLAEPLTELPLPATVQAGSDRHSVVIGFVHPETGSLVSVDLALLSGEVSNLSDDIRAHIIEIGHHLNTGDPGHVESLSGIIRAHIIEIGHQLEPEVQSFVADGIRAHIIEIGREYDFDEPADVSAFSDVIRAHIIEIGFQLDERGLRRGSVIGAPRVLDFAGEAGTSHQVNLLVTGSRPLAGLTAEDDPIVMLSPNGGEALIAWEQEGELRYQESQEEGWSEALALSLEGMPMAQALSILEHRIQNR